MALIVAVIREAAALAGEGPDEFCICDARFLELLPKEGAPAALVCPVSYASGGPQVRGLGMDSPGCR